MGATMSFMPNPGAVVRLADDHIGIVTKGTPRGDDDRVWVGTEEVKVSHINDIAEIIYEPEYQR